MINNFLFGHGMSLAIPHCIIYLIMKLENSMNTILIHFMNALLAAFLILMYKQLAAQINLKKVHLFSTQKTRNGGR
jgi:hypothetical protein